MATSNQDPLDVLQLMVNDVLVQTGKALRASRKDGKGNTAQAHGTVQSKLPDTLSTFHSTLDQLENDIVQAKSVLLRDLNQFKAQKMPAEQPQPIEAQSRTPMVIDLDSSPVEDQPLLIKAESKPVAPFPDMGTGIPDTPQADLVMKEETTSLLQDSSLGLGGFDVKAEAGTSSTPVDLDIDKNNADSASGVSGADGASGIPVPESNFTDMQFDLAPANGDSQSHSNAAQEPSFDLATFAPTDANEDMLDLDTFLPQSLNEQTNPPTTSGQVDANVSQEKPADKQEAGPNPVFNGMFTTTGGSPADGMDFDFELDGGGMGEDTFDDLIQDRDEGNFTMEHGEFDATYFGLDMPNDT